MNNLRRVYYNLHKKCLSVQHMTPKGWRVKEYKNSITLKNVKFVVYEVGRQKVLRQKRKNVHAFVIGEQIKRLPNNTQLWFIGKYNPYKYHKFYIETDIGMKVPIYTTKFCRIENRLIKLC